MTIDRDGAPDGLEDALERRVDTEAPGMQERLSKAERQYRELIEHARDGIFSLDLDGRFEVANAAFAELLGYTLEELLQRNIVDTYPEPMRAAGKQRLEALARGASLRFERPMVRKDGSGVFVEAIAWKTADGFLQSIVRDVTDRKRDEAEREKLAQQLLQAQKLESIGTLAGGIAHDFNNLLTGILGTLEVMRLDAVAEAAFRTELQAIESLVERGADLTRQLLGFSGRGKFAPKPFSLNALVVNTASLFGRTRKELTIRWVLAPGAAVVEAEATQLEQVLLTLLLNAGDAMPQGGDVAVETESVTLSERETRPHGGAGGRYIKLTVADTGIGMEPPVRERIFEPFFTTKGLGQHTGLGLSSVHGIVGNHGGWVTVASELGVGSTFTLFLPASEKPIEERPSPPGLSRGREETLLLVDDEEQILKVGSQLLTRLGYTVLTARSGKDALNLYRERQGQIALVILDLIMPGMDGGATFDALRRICPAVKVLLASGYSIEGQASEILARGCNGFLQKPYRLATLSQTLQALLANA